MAWLLNWIWQGTLLTAAVALALSCTSRVNAATRERIWWITLLGVLVLPLLHLLGSSAVAVVNATVPRPLPTGTVLVELPAALPVWWSLTWAVCALWSLGWLARLVVSIRALRRIRAAAVPFPKSFEQRLARWTAISATDRHFRTRLVLSDRIRHAAVLGLGRPLIAIAPASLVQLTADELDQVVIHEYAHVRRRDDVAALAQRVLCSVAAWHPAVWWVDRALTFEREVACDDWVLAHATAPAVYGACLLKLAEGREDAIWSLAPGAGVSRSQLARRVRRLLDTERNVSVSRSRLTLGTAAMTVACAAFITGQFPIVGVSRVSPVLQSVAVMTDLIDLPASSGTSTPIAPPMLAEISPLLRGNVASDTATPPSPDGTDIAGVFVFHVPSWSVDLIGAATVPTTVISPDALGGIVAPAALAHDALIRPEGASQLTNPSWTDRSPWLRVADAGVAIGGGARTAGVKTGGFFRRVGGSIGSAF